MTSRRPEVDPGRASHDRPTAGQRQAGQWPAGPWPAGERLLPEDLWLLAQLYGPDHPAARALELARDMHRPRFRLDGRYLYVEEVDVAGRVVDPLADTVVLPALRDRR